MLLAGAPDGFAEIALVPMPDDVSIVRSARAPLDVAVVFAIA